MTGIRLRLTRLRGVRAVRDLGIQLAASGDVDGADAAFRHVINTAAVFFGLTATLHLWVLHARKGDRRRAHAVLDGELRLPGAHVKGYARLDGSTIRDGVFARNLNVETVCTASSGTRPTVRSTARGTPT